MYVSLHLLNLLISDYELQLWFRQKLAERIFDVLVRLLICRVNSRCIGRLLPIFALVKILVDIHLVSQRGLRKRVLSLPFSLWEPEASLDQVTAMALANLRSRGSHRAGLKLRICTA